MTNEELRAEARRLAYYTHGFISLEVNPERERQTAEAADLASDVWEPVVDRLRGGLRRLSLQDYDSGYTPELRRSDLERSRAQRQGIPVTKAGLPWSPGAVAAVAAAIHDDGGGCCELGYVGCDNQDAARRAAVVALSAWFADEMLLRKAGGRG